VALGLVTSSAPGADVLDTARELTRAFAAKSSELMHLGKAAFGRVTDNRYRQGAANAIDLVSTVFGTPDCRESLQAFVEKRQPVWGQP
jgi:enoyl-CoA hydratase